MYLLFIQRNIDAIILIDSKKSLVEDFSLKYSFGLIIFQIFLDKGVFLTYIHFFSWANRWSNGLSLARVWKQSDIDLCGMSAREPKKTKDSVLDKKRHSVHDLGVQNRTRKRTSSEARGEPQVQVLQLPGICP